MLRAALLSLAVLAAPATELAKSATWQAPSQEAKPATNIKDPVCKMPVTAKSMTMTVRGQEYRVCSKHCADALQKDPDKYLEKDGSVKAEKK
jgi:YHS domain-containing protein